MAETSQVTRRSLRNWKRENPEEPKAPPGRPPTPPEKVERARELVREQLELQGWGAGEGPVHRALDGVVSLWLVRRVLGELKAEHRAAVRAHREEHRVSVEVKARDVLWSLDATHVGRNDRGAAVQAEVVREVASTCTITLSIGPAATDEEVVALLDRAAAERGGCPLVLATDNGGAYISDLVERWCERHGVLHVLSLPHTPQHNAWSEHGMGELKHDAELGKGTLVKSTEEARARLEASAERLDGHRLRRTRGWRTAVEADRELPHWSELVTRERVKSEATCAIDQAVLYYPQGRARRRAVREAVLGTLEQLALITRTRGGRPWCAEDAERVS